MIAAALNKQVSSFPGYAGMYGVKIGENKFITDEAFSKAAEGLVVVKITMQ